MLVPAKSHEPPDDQYSPDTNTTAYTPAHRDDAQRSVTLSVRMEMRRLGAERPDRGAKRQAIARCLAWLRRIFGVAVAETPPPLEAGSGQEDQSVGRHPPNPSGSRGAAPSFWEALTMTEQEALRSLACLKVFATGERLMREGEPADFVIVILNGRTMVCVDENGRERAVTERGPGQLIGERAGLQRSVRSASVIALEEVHGLMIGTEDFTVFVDAHPNVFDIVESQLYSRLTENPAGYWHGNSIAGFTALPAGTGLAPALAQPVRLSGEHCTILLTDVVGFGSRTRNDQDRRTIREALFNMTRVTFQGMPGVHFEDRGDGFLTIVPPSVPTANVIARLVNELRPALDHYNWTHRDTARFQLRAAINVGPVTSDVPGVSGEAIIIAARLVEAPIFKKAMAETKASFGVISSSFVYDTVIRHGVDRIDLASYSPVQLEIKELSILAWMKIFDATLPSSGSAHPIPDEPYALSR